MERSISREKLIQARTNLLMAEPFYSIVAMQLEFKEDAEAQGMWTDGVSIGYSPKYVEESNNDALVARLVKLASHVAHLHPFRRDNRDEGDWNRACDRSLYSELKQSNYPLPPDVQVDKSDLGMAAEAIYEKIHVTKPPARQQPQPNPQGSPQNAGDNGGNGKPDPQGKDGQEKPQPKQGEGSDPGGRSKPQPMDVRDYPGQDSAAKRDDWKIKVIQAAQAAKMQGSLPAGIEQLVDQIKNPQIDWKAALRRFIQQNAKSDYTWKLPNRRYIAQGLYLPSVHSENMPALAILWDSSGSRDTSEARAECAAEVADIFQELKPEKLYVIYCDAKVQRVECFEPGDVVTFNPKGGGGTDFRPAFDYIEAGDSVKPTKDLVPIDTPIACMVCITDLWGTFPDEAPEYPVIWCATSRDEPPFGEVLRISQ